MIDPLTTGRLRRIAMFGCLGIVGVVVACSGIYYIVANSGFKVVGKTDPAISYSIEYTVSSRYIKLRDSSIFNSVDFGPKPPPPLFEWVRTHILRAANAPTSPAGDSLVISQYSLATSSGSILMLDEHGYPEMRDMNIKLMTRHEHRLISHFPCTWVTMDSGQIGPNGSRDFLTGFAIHPTDSPVCFAFAAFPEGATQCAEVTDELAAIRDSVRITKVKQAAP